MCRPVVVHSLFFPPKFKISVEDPWMISKKPARNAIATNDVQKGHTTSKNANECVHDWHQKDCRQHLGIPSVECWYCHERTVDVILLHEFVNAIVIFFLSSFFFSGIYLNQDTPMKFPCISASKKKGERGKPQIRLTQTH